MKTPLDFGAVNRGELVVLDAIADILHPDELAGEGYTLAVVDGRRIWQFQSAALRFTLVGEAVETSPSVGVVVPVRILEDAFDVATVDTEARLIVEGGCIHVGEGNDLVAIGVSVGAQVAEPIGPFETTCAIPASALTQMLATTTIYPFHSGDRPANWPMAEIGIHENFVQTHVDWEVAGGRPVISRKSTVTTGPEWYFVTTMWCLSTTHRLISRLKDLPGDGYSGDWTIEVGTEDDEYIRFSTNDVEIVIPRFPSIAQNLLSQVAEVIGNELGTEVTIAARTTIEAVIDNEPLVGEVFSGDGLHLRMSVPVGDIDPLNLTDVLAEINGHNESKLTSTAFVDETTVHVRHVLANGPGLRNAIPPAVLSLVADAKALRSNLALVTSLGGDVA